MELSTRLIADLVRIREVLAANNVDKIVDEDIIIALLEVYQSDNERVDLVVLDLEGMLGMQLEVGAQQARWNELQTRGISPDVVTIEYEHIQQANNNLIDAPVNLIAQTAQNVQGASNTAMPLPSTSGAVMLHREPRQLHAPDLKQISTARVAKHPQAVNVGSSAQVNAASLAVTSKGKKRRLPPDAHKPAAIPVTPEITSSNSSEGAKSIKVESSTSTDFVFEQQDSSPKRFKFSKEEIESVSVTYHKSLLNAFPVMHIKYAAYLVTEFTTSATFDLQWNEFLFKTKKSINIQRVPKAGTKWNLPENIDSERERLTNHIYDHYLNEQLDFLILTIPDVDPMFLEEEVKNSEGDQEKIRELVTSILDGTRAFPSRADYNKRKEYNDLANRFFTIEEFFDLYDDPLVHFRDDSRVTDESYRDEAINQLKVDFRSVSMHHIRRMFFSNKHHFTPTYLAIKSDLSVHSLKTKRSVNEFLKMKTKDLFLLQEVAFVRLLPEIEIYQKNKEQMRVDAVAISRANGTLMDCPICCEDELIELDFVCCPNMHAVCKNCVRRQTEELIGMMKNHIPCLSPDCSTEYSLETIKSVIKKSVFLRLEKRRLAEEINAAGIEGLESCPFCDYCEVPNENTSLFQCKFPDCLQISCRQCRELNHLPLRCEEFAMKQRLNNYVETKMTEALLRQCPSCKKSIVKSDGCNKVICVCGTIICYICRKQIKDYSHFADNRNPQNQSQNNVSKKCTLFSDTNKLHEEEVAKSAQNARAELASSNPNIRIDLVVGKK